MKEMGSNEGNLIAPSPSPPVTRVVGRNLLRLELKSGYATDASNNEWSKNYLRIDNAISIIFIRSAGFHKREARKPFLLATNP